MWARCERPWCKFCTKKNKHFLEAYSQHILHACALLFFQGLNPSSLSPVRCEKDLELPQTSRLPEAKSRSSLVASLVFENAPFKYTEKRNTASLTPLKEPVRVCVLHKNKDQPRARPVSSVEQERHQVTGCSKATGGRRPVMRLYGSVKCAHKAT